MKQKNAYLLAKIGADTTENERNSLKIGNYPTGLLPYGPASMVAPASRPRPREKRIDRIGLGASMQHLRGSTLVDASVLGNIHTLDLSYNDNVYSVGSLGYALFTFPPPVLCNGVKIDFAVRLAAVPGRHSGDQVHKVKKVAAPFFWHFTALGVCTA